MNIKLVKPFFLILAFSTNLDTYSTSLGLIKKQYPQLYGLAKLTHKIPKKISSQNIFNFAFELQYEALKKNEVVSTTPNLLYLVAKHFALQYLYDLVQGNIDKAITYVTPDELPLVEEYLQALAEKVTTKALTYLLLNLFTRDTNNSADNHDISSHLEPILQLVTPLHLIMTAGSDHRSNFLHNTHTNKFYTTTIPQKNLIARSHCTSAVPTFNGYFHAEKAHQKLLTALLKGEADQVFSHQFSHIRNTIKNNLLSKEIRSKTSVVLCPSGCDAELFPTLLALTKHPQYTPSFVENFDKKMHKPLVLNIVVADGEVGVGTALACAGRHFSHQLPNGKIADYGTLLDGIPEGMVELAQLPARNSLDGSVSAKDRQVNQLEKSVTKAIERDNQIVVLHLVHYSKTGILSPLPELVIALKNRYGNKLVVMVDAAQMRFPKKLISTYLHSGFNIMLTGSKFFSSPPFCACVLIPNAHAQEFKSKDFYYPIGFSDYFSSEEIDPTLESLCNKLSSWQNVGLMLRWSTILPQFRQYFSIPTSRKNKIVKEWVQFIEQQVDKTNYLERLETKHYNNARYLLGQTDSVIKIKVQPPSENRFLNLQELRHIHKLLAEDISQLLPENSTNYEQDICKNRCLFGQPVAILRGQDGFAVLRFALSAHMIIKYSRGKKERLQTQDQIALQKLSTIAKYYEYLLSRSTFEHTDIEVMPAHIANFMNSIKKIV